MRRRIRRPFTPEDIEFSEKRFELSERRKRLFNRIYRNSCLYKTAWRIRSFYFIFFLIILPLFSGFTTAEKEVVIDVNHMVYKSRGAHRGGNLTYHTLLFATNEEEYKIDATFNGPTPLYIGDTVLIMRNVFGKAVHYSKPEWPNKYLITGNIVYYIVSHFIIFITCFFNDADTNNNRILWFSIVFCIIIILLYIFC